MSRSTGSALPVLVAGGGIGGIAAALALVRQGFSVKVLEQAAQLGEIGAGIQLGPNAFAAFDALGIGEIARSRAVYTDEMVMHDAIDEYCVGRIPTGEAFRKRFNNPYAVIHRADVHGSLLEGAQATDRIEVATGTQVQRVEQSDDSVTVHDARISVRAGFRDTELSSIWPGEREWTLKEQKAGRFTHCFVARKMSTAPFMSTAPL